MTRKLGVLVAVLAVLGSVGLNVPAASATGDEAPLRATYEGTAVANFPAGTVTFSGTGLATVLGRSSNAGQIQITGPSSSCPGGVANINTQTLTAANGDTLVIISDDVACPTDSTGTRFHGTGQWQVIGGTGRFDGATGHGAIDGRFDFNLGAFVIQLTGTISVPEDN